MLARTSILGILTLLAPAHSAQRQPYYSLSTWGALGITASGDEARMGRVSLEGHGRSMLMVSIGINDPHASVSLYLPDSPDPAPGRYRVSSSWLPAGTGAPLAHATLMAGSVERPLGWFEGQSGWVTLRRGEQGELAGEFEFAARGFLRDNPDNERQKVMVRGSFRVEREEVVARGSSAW